MRGGARHHRLAFCQKEGRFWNSDLQIVDFDRVRETAFRPWAADTIPRRFCSAMAPISDGSKHAVNYWIGEDTGFIGATWGVTWCVTGLDRNWAYNPRCKMARPLSRRPKPQMGGLTRLILFLICSYYGGTV